MRARIQTIPTGGGGGGGGKDRIASRWSFVPVFLLGNEWQLMIFTVRTPCPLCLRPYQSFKFEFTFYLYFFLLGLVKSQNVC